MLQVFLHYFLQISIHAAREGGDLLNVGKLAMLTISIHAAREGGDDRGVSHELVRHHFNPRRP